MLAMPPLSLPADPAVLIFLAGVFLFGSVINGLLGFGLALVAVNATANVIDVKLGVLTLSIIAPFLSSSQLRHNWSYFHGWSRLRSLTLGAIVGTVFGAQLLVNLPTWAIGLALGIFTVWFAIDRLRRDRPAVAKTTEQRMAPVAGFVGGTMNSALGASGPIFGSYLYAIGLKGREFAFGISVVFFIQALVRVGSFAALGQFNASILSMAFVLFWPSVAGQYIGQALQGRVDSKAFQRVLLAVLLISSLNLLLQGGRGLLGFLGIPIR